MKITPRVGVALLAGVVMAVAIAVAATLLARALWPDYAAAEPDKAYSLAMLVARLGAGALAVMGGAWVTAGVARDKGAAALWLGVLFLAVSSWDHLFRVWADYPAWYHFVYLAYLVPVAALTGRAASRRAAR